MANAKVKTTSKKAVSKKAVKKDVVKIQHPIIRLSNMIMSTLKVVKVDMITKNKASTQSQIAQHIGDIVMPAIITLKEKWMLSGKLTNTLPFRMNYVPSNLDMDDDVSFLTTTTGILLNKGKNNNCKVSSGARGTLSKQLAYLLDEQIDSPKYKALCKKYNL